MRMVAAAALLSLLGCRSTFEEHDRALDPDQDGAIVTLDCESDNATLYYKLWYRDLDLDGYGDPSTLVDSCEPPDSASAWVNDGTDCNDEDPASHARRSGHLDLDMDGFGAGEVLSVCDATTTLAEVDGDCDDADAQVSPAAVEVCGNVVDDNCDAQPDCEGLEGDVAVTERGARVAGLTTEGLGAALASAGDLDGDGTGDLIFGAPGEDGVVYALLGPLGAEGAATELANARLLGERGAAAGSALSGVGDMDGDGYDDFLVGSPEAGEGGRAYLVPGPIRAVSDAGEDAALELGRDVVKLGTDEAAVSLGWALAGPGDLLGEDGVADMVVGAPEAAEGAGVVWIAAGPLGEDLTVEDGAVRVEGQAYSGLGTTMARLQDIDGDGVHELALGAPGFGEGEMASPWRRPDPVGAVYIVGAVEEGPVDELADARVVGEEIESGFASVLGDVGDMDGDGVGDLVVSAPRANYSAGKVWLFSGEVLAEGGDVRLEDAMAEIEGETRESGVGTSLTSAGDLNMDGELDLLIGAAWTTLNRLEKVGAATLWYGPIAGSFSSDAADALILGDGEYQGQFGYAAAVTADGTVAIGAPMTDFVDEAVMIEDPFGDGALSAWGRSDETWGDGAVYVIHAGY